MKGNDISNRQAFNIAFRVEDFLLEFQTEGVVNKFSNFLIGELYNAEIDKTLLSIMYKLFRRTDYTADLIALKENKGSYLEERLSDVPYSDLIYVENDAEITELLRTGRVKFFVDKQDRLSTINHKYAISLERLGQMI